MGYSINELAVGQKASFSKTVTESDIYLFAGITGDTEGFFVQICECAMVFAVLLAQKAGELL